MNKGIRRLLLKILKLTNEHDMVKKKEEMYSLLRPRTNNELSYAYYDIIEKNVKLIKSYHSYDSIVIFEVPHS